MREAGCISHDLMELIQHSLRWPLTSTVANEVTLVANRTRPGADDRDRATAGADTFLIEDAYASIHGGGMH
jgi:hypothetical protein